jgi:hypothetical protein
MPRRDRAQHTTLYRAAKWRPRLTSALAAWSAQYHNLGEFSSARIRAKRSAAVSSAMVVRVTLERSVVQLSGH